MVALGSLCFETFEKLNVLHVLGKFCFFATIFLNSNSTCVCKMDPKLKSIISQLTKLRKAMAVSEIKPEEAYAIKLNDDIPRYVLSPLYSL